MIRDEQIHIPRVRSRFNKRKPQGGVSGRRGAKAPHEVCLAAPRFAPLPPGQVSVTNVLASPKVDVPRPVTKPNPRRNPRPAAAPSDDSGRGGLRGGKPITDQERERAVQLLREGRSIMAVCVMLGRSDSAIRRIMYAHEQATDEKLPRQELVQLNIRREV